MWSSLNMGREQLGKVKILQRIHCFREEHKLVLGSNYDVWKKQGLVVTRDSRSRLEGRKPQLSKVKYQKKEGNLKP